MHLVVFEKFKCLLILNYGQLTDGPTRQRQLADV